MGGDGVQAIIPGVQAITSTMLINASGAVTGEIGFDAPGDTINPVPTLHRVEGGQWIPVE